MRYGDAKKDAPGMCASGIESIKNALKEEGTLSGVYDNPVHNFFLALSICHSVQIHIDAKGVKRFQASSPDELALVNGASDVGMVFDSRIHDILNIMSPLGDLEFKLLCEMPFDSTRKCMSVIVRDCAG